MLRLLFMLMLISTPAWPHPSMLPHDHPHGLSGIPASEALVIGFILGALVMAMILKLMRE